MRKLSAKLLSSCLILMFILIVGTSFALFAGPKPAEEVLSQAPSREDYPDSDAVYMLDKGVVKIDSKAEKKVTVTRRIKIFNKQGRQEFGEVKIRYQEQSGEPKLNWARTITPDGKVIKPDKESIKTVTPARLQEYPMYTSIKNKVISMPGLTNGAIIEYSYTLTPKEFLLKGDFASGWQFRYLQPVMDSYFKVTFPSDMKVKWTDFDADLPPEEKKEDKRKILVWDRKNLEKIIREPAMGPLSSISEKVLVTSVKSWERYAEDAWRLFKGRAEPDEAIKSKVKELTEGLKTKEEKIHALYNYVATKIRYVAIELGHGGYQPHKATKTFRNKYGDCKDKATLLVSMLRVAGIEAHPVLVRAGINGKTRFEEPPPGQRFNHAIVAVESEGELQLLDPTCDTCPYDYLSAADRGKKVLALVPSGDQVKKIIESEPFKPENSRVVVEQLVKLNKEGDLETNIEITHSGYYNSSLKSLLERWSKVRQKRFYRSVLSQLESGATLEDFSHSDLEALDEQLRINLSYKKKGYADTLGNSLIFQTPPSLRLPLDRTLGQRVSLPEKKRKYPLYVVPVTLVNKITISYPEGKKIVAPDGVDLDTEWTSYSSTYKSKGENKLSVTRKYVIKKSLIELKNYPEFKKVINRMRKGQQSNFQIKS